MLLIECSLVFRYTLLCYSRIPIYERATANICVYCVRIEWLPLLIHTVVLSTSVLRTWYVYLFFKPRFCLRRVLVMTYVGGLRSPPALHFRVRATRLLGEVRAAVGVDGATRRDATTSERAVRTDSS